MKSVSPSLCPARDVVSTLLSSPPPASPVISTGLVLKKWYCFFLRNFLFLSFWLNSPFLLQGQQESGTMWLINGLLHGCKRKWQSCSNDTTAEPGLVEILAAPKAQFNCTLFSSTQICWVQDWSEFNRTKRDRKKARILTLQKLQGLLLSYLAYGT